MELCLPLSQITELSVYGPGLSPRSGSDVSIYLQGRGFTDH